MTSLLKNKFTIIALVCISLSVIAHFIIPNLPILPVVVLCFISAAISGIFITLSQKKHIKKKLKVLKVPQYPKLVAAEKKDDSQMLKQLHDKVGYKPEKKKFLKSI